MASLNIPYAFTNGTPSNATEVNADFTAVKSFVEAQLVSVDGAVKAPTVAIEDLAVTTAKLADLGVTTGKLADSSVTAVKIADGTVGTAELANDAVTADKVADGATLPVNITGNAAYATNAGHATTADSAFNQSLNNYDSPEFFRVNATGTDPLYTPYLTSSTSVAGLVLRSDGVVCKNSSSSVSLREVKENIVDIDAALVKLNRLRPRNFKFKDSYVESSLLEDTHDMLVQKQYGFIVEEVVDVDADLVHHVVKDGSLSPQMWKSNAVVSLAVAAIQELSAKVEALEAEIKVLKNG